MSVDRINDSNLMWKIAGGLIAIMAIGASYLWFNQQQAVSIDAEKSPAKVTQVNTEPTTPTASKVTTQIPTDITPSSSNITLVNDSILKDKVPENPSLAKEEIAKLDDIEKQLSAQQETLIAQQKDADQLIQLKEEQIKILEKQIAAQN